MNFKTFFTQANPVCAAIFALGFLTGITFASIFISSNTSGRSTNIEDKNSSIQPNNLEQMKAELEYVQKQYELLQQQQELLRKNVTTLNDSMNISLDKLDKANSALLYKNPEK